MPAYFGIFLIALAALALEVTLSRLLSVITWYHLAFFAVAVAMLGMTAGATTVYLAPRWFGPKDVERSTAISCLVFALVVPAALVLLCLTPIHTGLTVMSLFSVLVVTCAAAMPFYCAGIAIAAVLTRFPMPVSRLYAADLIGASFGCVFALVGLDSLDAPSLIMLCGAVGALAAFCFSWQPERRRLRWLAACVACLLAVASLMNSRTPHGLRPLFVKSRLEAAGGYLFERWNSFSRVVVYPGQTAPPQYWGPSPLAPRDPVPQFLMNIDGDAATTIQRFSSEQDLKHLEFDVTNLAYYLRPSGGVCVVGVGGGRDIQSAIHFGHRRVVGVEVNPIFVELLETNFREFAGIAERSDVELVVDEARSFLTRELERFSVIQMSLIDTWAATGAGAFSLSENGLYTVEAWQAFFARLAPDGIFTVSRWYSPNQPSETGRLVSLAVSSLLRSGAENPARHLALVSGANSFNAYGQVATLLVSKKEFSGADLRRLRRVVSDLRFIPVILPDEHPTNDVLRAIVSAGSDEELAVAIADEPLNYSPPTDENPYFFNMLRLGRLGPILAKTSGVVRGNLVASLTLAALLVALALLAVVTVVFPLVLGSRVGMAGDVFWPAAVYFSLIGAGFMFVEIALIQRLSLFLGHPVYALAVILCAVIASTGAGSLVSERLPLDSRPWVLVYPLVTALGVLLAYGVLQAVLPATMAWPTGAKIAVAMVLIWPLGMTMGVCFPTGMRLVQSRQAVETPWYWALNGIFGVLCSSLAVAISLFAGVSLNFWIAALCYVALVPCLHLMSTTVTAGQAR